MKRRATATETPLEIDVTSEEVLADLAPGWLAWTSQIEADREAAREPAVAA